MEQILGFSKSFKIYQKSLQMGAKSKPKNGVAPSAPPNLLPQLWTQNRSNFAWCCLDSFHTTYQWPVSDCSARQCTLIGENCNAALDTLDYCRFNLRCLCKCYFTFLEECQMCVMKCISSQKIYCFWFNLDLLVAWRQKKCQFSFSHNLSLKMNVRAKFSGQFFTFSLINLISFKSWQCLLRLHLCIHKQKFKFNLVFCKIFWFKFTFKGLLRGSKCQLKFKLDLEKCSIHFTDLKIDRQMSTSDFSHS